MTAARTSHELLALARADIEAHGLHQDGGYCPYGAGPEDYSTCPKCTLGALHFAAFGNPNEETGIYGATVHANAEAHAVAERVLIGAFERRNPSEHALVIWNDEAATQADALALYDATLDTPIVAVSK